MASNYPLNPADISSRERNLYSKIKHNGKQYWTHNTLIRNEDVNTKALNLNQYCLNQSVYFLKKPTRRYTKILKNKLE